ncbi:MAG: ATP phosphoribosyltransferase regulatory subunit [Leptospiraceae bacterium]|nr:ATP phosphoribosyltransferase regulatory subunit [Leptospiraceae bacterium]MCK6382420.1 ATP phosphoribosyltransferase regulatory subunit [Leptospiraceae bacterium]
MDKLQKTIGKSGELKWIPDGFHFLSPEKSTYRRKLLDKIHKFFMKNGYLEVIPPSFDFSSSFSGHLSEMEKTHLLKYKDLSGSEISPSFDLTIQVVKGMASFSYPTETQKVFYSSRVIKDSQRKNGSKRETFQLGAEIIGRSDYHTFIGLLEELENLFLNINFPYPITLVLGNTLVFEKISTFLNLNSTEKELFSDIVYSKNTPSLNGFFQDKEVPVDFQNLIRSILFNFDFHNLKTDILHISKKYDLKLENLISETENILSVWNEKKRAFDFCLDFSLIRDLNYYTGFVFHAYSGNISDPVFMGGAYDHLYERYSGVQKNACGFAMSMDIVEELLKNERIGV